MTAEAVVARAGFPRPRRRDRPARSVSAVAGRGSVPPLGRRLQLVRAALVVVLVVSVSLLVQLVAVSSLQHSAAQGRAYDDFRAQLATGTAPIGPSGTDDQELSAGTPVAFLEIPAIDVREVIGEGTTSSVLFDGPGHRRDTPLPGQIGTSIVLGRRAAYGGPFAHLDELVAGDRATVTTGQGVFEFRVAGLRVEGAPAPEPPGVDDARLVLVTATGSPFLPDGVLRVDLELDADSAAVVGPARLLGSTALAADERVMAHESSRLWALALWLQALIAVALGAVWAWHRWGRAQAWVVFLPPLALVGLFVAGEAARLLPNVM